MPGTTRRAPGTEYWTLDMARRAPGTVHWALDTARRAPGTEHRALDMARRAPGTKCQTLKADQDWRIRNQKQERHSNQHEEKK